MNKLLKGPKPGFRTDFIHSIEIAKTNFNELDRKNYIKKNTLKHKRKIKCRLSDISSQIDSFAMEFDAYDVVFEVKMYEHNFNKQYNVMIFKDRIFNFVNSQPDVQNGVIVAHYGLSPIKLSNID